MKPRTILHCDMNNCFASIEIKLNPALRGKPVAVCGSKEERHGIVLAKSEEAKKYGVKTAEVIWQAQRKCPDLIIVPPHFEEYRKYSRLARKIYCEYTDLVESFGLDECWLDVTGSERLFGSGEKIAYEIKERIKAELGVTISVGVSFNKVFAKLGSDLKKPDAVTVIPYLGFQRLIWNLPVSDMLGVGQKTAVKLSSYGIHTIGDLARVPPEIMKRRMGKAGEEIWRYANGLDCSPVSKEDFIPPPKSIGRGVTCAKDLFSAEEVWRVLYLLAEEVAGGLRKEHFSALGVQLVIRDNTLFDKQLQKQLILPTQSAKEIAKQAFSLFEGYYHWTHPVRALTVRVLHLIDEKTPEQIFWDSDIEKREKTERIESTVFKLRNRFGKNCVTAATLLHRDAPQLDDTRAGDQKLFRKG